MEGKYPVTLKPIFAAIIAVTCVAFVPALLVAESQNSAATAPPAQKTAASTNPAPVHQDEDDGDVLHELHCSRCHAYPEDVPVRVRGTVLRHMRVRASLSKREEQELLKFLVPQPLPTK